MTKEEIYLLIASASFDGFFLTTPRRAHTLLTGATPLDIVFEPDDVDTHQVIETVYALSTLAARHRTEMETALHTMYLRSVENESGHFASSRQQIDCEAQFGSTEVDPLPPRCPADIWRLVRFCTITVQRNRTGLVTAALRGDATWDAEDGIALFFGKGEQLTSSAPSLPLPHLANNASAAASFAS